MTQTLHECKSQLRRRLLQSRDRIPEDRRREKSLQITDRLLGLPVVREAGCVFMYVAFRSEVQTQSAIAALLDQGRTVCVPWTDTGAGGLIPARITDLDDLTPGAMGIPEPDPSTLQAIPRDTIDVVVLPGAGFDCHGWRIGYGGGYYDRFLRAGTFHTVGLAFEAQVVTSVPHDPAFDCPVEEVLTEARTIQCGRALQPGAL